jgi:hypothetical protein
MSKYLKALSASFVFVVLLTLGAKNTSAITDPLSVPNNPFGIHILDEIDLEDASRLVNSSGGDWGYVTLVIRKDERNIKRWQAVFDKMRKLHLIPIVRLATTTQNEHWEKFEKGDIENWVYFLNSLNWVVKNRYVIIGNEPNHANEWGKEIKPAEYSEILKSFSNHLKEASDDFFILPAGFDASAPNSKNSKKEEDYIKEMLIFDANIFNYIDGWTSHSYPNPDFSGSEFDQGKGTIRTFEWEIQLLKSLGVGKELPVFITETGWLNSSNETGSENLIADKMSYAYTNVWNNGNVVAVTPFVLNYQEPPFDKFSWKNKDGGFYHIFERIQKIPKIKGEPVQIDDGEIILTFTPNFYRQGDTLYGIAIAKNKGQSIWENNQVYLTTKKNGPISVNTLITSYVEPESKVIINFSGNLPQEPGSYTSSLVFEKNGRKFGSAHQIRITTYKSGNSEDNSLVSRLSSLLQKVREFF